MILPIFNIPSWDANRESCTMSIWGSKSVAHRFLNSHSSSRPCEFVGQFAHLWNAQKLWKIQTDHNVTLKIYENDQHVSYIACFILPPLSSDCHQCFINLSLSKHNGTTWHRNHWHGSSVMRSFWRCHEARLPDKWTFVSTEGVPTAWVAWKVSQCFTRFHKPQSFSRSIPWYLHIEHENTSLLSRVFRPPQWDFAVCWRVFQLLAAWAATSHCAFPTMQGSYSLPSDFEQYIKCIDAVSSGHIRAS